MNQIVLFENLKVSFYWPTLKAQPSLWRRQIGNDKQHFSYPLSAGFYSNRN